MKSRLCSLPKVPATSPEDETSVIEEAIDMIEDMDETAVPFGSKRLPVFVTPLLKTALECAPDRKGKAWLSRIIVATEGVTPKLKEVGQLFFLELLVPST